MQTVDTNAINGRILNFLGRNGPSLPVHIAKEIGMDMIFASAFLSELCSHQKLKTSHMKVGTSPIYLIPGQERGLEKFSEYIKGKEHEALSLLKRKGFLVDSEQEIAIKVALREIKDFAKPFEREGKLIWKYFLADEREFQKEKIKEPRKEKKEEPKTERKKPKEAKRKKTVSKKTSDRKNDKFFNKTKEYLKHKGMEISDIIGFNKKDLTLKIKKNGQEKLIVAYNKKRITEKDILDAYKKAKEIKLDYLILSLGEPTKKITNMIDAAKRLDSLEKIK